MLEERKERQETIKSDSLNRKKYNFCFTDLKLRRVQFMQAARFYSHENFRVKQGRTSSFK